MRPRRRGGIDRDDRRGERDLIACFDFGGHRLDVDAAVKKDLGDNGIFWTAYDRGAERDDLADEITALARQFAGQVTAEAPADQVDFLIAAARERRDPLQDTRKQFRRVAAVTSQTPAARPITEQAEVNFQ